MVTLWYASTSFLRSKKKYLCLCYWCFVFKENSEAGMLVK